jgi:hypothetical protein
VDRVIDVMEKLIVDRCDSILKCNQDVNLADLAQLIDVYTALKREF